MFNIVSKSWSLRFSGSSIAIPISWESLTSEREFLNHVLILVPNCLLALQGADSLKTP